MRRYLPLAVVLLVTAVLVLLLDNFLRAVIVQPLLYAAWFMGLVLSSLHQSVFWSVLLFMALVLMLRSLGGGKRKPRSRPGKRYPAQGQVRRWTLLLERAETQRFARWNLAQALRRLAQEVLQPDERRGSNQPRRPIEDRLTPDIETYFNAKLPPAQTLTLRQRLQTKSLQPSHPLDLDPEVVVDFLEQATGHLAGE